MSQRRAFLAVNMEPVVTCAKCGRPTPSPGRMCYFDGETLRYWCDCVTEEEMDQVALDFTNQVKLESLSEINERTCDA
jgi:hypothetical protein